MTLWGVSSIGQLKHLRLLSSNFEPVPAEWVGQRKWVGSHGGAEWVGQRKWVESHGSFTLGCRKPSVNIGWAPFSGLKDIHLAL